MVVRFWDKFPYIVGHAQKSAEGSKDCYILDSSDFSALLGNAMSHEGYCIRPQFQFFRV